MLTNFNNVPISDSGSIMMPDIGTITRYKKSYRGYYVGNYCRSYIEFLFALYLNKVKNVNFSIETISFISKITGKRKVPDFVIYDSDGIITEVVEIKSSEDENQQLIVNYALSNYNLPVDAKISFVKIDRKVKRHLKKQIIDVIGLQEFNDEEKKFKEQTNLVKILGFKGELNPMYGKKHSNTAKEKISAALKNKFSGSKNPMYGKTHTKDAKKKIAAKWLDSNRKTEMQATGMITHIKRFSPSELEMFVTYATLKFECKESNRPAFLNRAYTVSIEKIINIFGSVENFWKKVYEKNV
jgi:hypothetical protein